MSELNKIILNDVPYDLGGSGDGLTEDIKTALLQIANKCAYIDEDGADYYNNLYDALYPPTDLVQITAVFTQQGAIYETASLDDLKPYLVVTALFDDQSSRVLSASEYNLVGTLTEGTSIISATYRGKTASFSVTVSVYSTSPVIATEGVCWSKTAPDTVNKAGFGITQWYPFEFTQEILESCNYWDSTNQYMTTSGWAAIKYFNPDGEAYAAGNSWPSAANYKHVTGIDGVYTGMASITRNEEAHIQFLRQSVNWTKMNGVSFSIPLLDKEYAYAYWEKDLTYSIVPVGVSFGDIIFAGKNTPYYGLSNISEAPTLSSISADFEQGDNIITENSTLNSLKSMLTVSATYDNNRTIPVNRAVYTLSGTLTQGDSTITATYEGKTATFVVSVTA